jgi:hypothetical protein
MRGQVGNWGGEQLSIGFGDEMLAWLDSFGCKRHFMASAVLIADGSAPVRRRIVLAPDTEPGAVFSRVHNHGDAAALRFHGKVPHDRVFELELLKLPRFELHDVQFEADDDGALYGDLADDHELPWPRLRKECALYTCADVFMADLIQRMVSALKAGQKGFIGKQRPPQRLIDTITLTAWRDCMDKARRIVG